jgi:peroxiredoxin/ubiquinone/menaquinone biosynthesis C-methylase UbiE
MTFILLFLLMDVSPRKLIDVRAYDTFSRFMFSESYNIHAMIAMQIKERCGIENGRVLELAFCAPHTSIELAKLTDVSFDVLVEDSIELIVCKERVQGSGYGSRFTFHVGKSDSMSFSDSSFDLVLARDALRFWHADAKVYREINRVLKPGAAAYLGGGLGHEFSGPQGERIWNMVQDWRNATDHIPWAATLPFPEHIETALMMAGISNYEVWTEGHCTCRTWVTWRRTQSVSSSVYNIHHIQALMDSLQDINTPAADFTLSAVTGEEITLSKLRGKVVVLDFWAANCRSCVWMMKQLAPIHEAYAVKGCKFFAINIDDEKGKMDAFLQEKSISYTVLYDDRDVHRTYGIRGIPHFVIIDKQGIIHERIVGGTSETVTHIESTLMKLTAE